MTFLLGFLKYTKDYCQKKRLLSRFKTPKKSIAFFRIESKNLYKK